jgi:hypothetical protein
VATEPKPKQHVLPLCDESSGRKVVIQRSPITGFRHHEAPFVWSALQKSVPVTLAREPSNRHDPDAVALYWKGRKLGYLPRGENFMVARLLERERRLGARIRRLSPKAERNRRIQVEVLLR